MERVSYIHSDSAVLFFVTIETSFTQVGGVVGKVRITANIRSIKFNGKWYLYRAFLVFLTNQSAFTLHVTFTHSYTH